VASKLLSIETRRGVKRAGQGAGAGENLGLPPGQRWYGSADGTELGSPGRAPMRRAAATRSRLSRGSIAPMPTPNLGRPFARGSGDPSFVGRASELAECDRLVEESLRGESRWVVVDGPPGIGKSRFLRCLGSIVSARGFAVLSARGREGGGAGFFALREVLGGALEAPCSSPTPDEALSWVEGCLERSRSGPTALFVDDAHWLDAESLRALEELVFECSSSARRGEIALYVALAFQPEPPRAAARFLARVTREPIVARVRLAGLDETALYTLTCERGFDPPSSQLVRLVEHVSGGNPLHAQDVLRSLSRPGAAEVLHGVWVPREDPGLLHGIEEIDQALASRLEDLSPPARELLRVAAVLGGEVDPQWIASVGGSSPAAAEAAVEEAFQLGLLCVTEGRLGFRHALLRDVVRAEASPPLQRKIRLARATHLQTVPGSGSSVEIARDLIAAGSLADPARVLEASQRAAAACLERRDHAGAAEFFEAAIVALDKQPESDRMQSASMHEQAGLAHSRNADAGPALHHYERAAAHYRAIGAHPELVRTLSAELRARFTLAPVPYGTLTPIDSLVGALAVLGDASLAMRGIALSALAEAHWHARRSDEAAELAAEAVALGRKTGDRSVLARGLHASALIAAQGLDLERAVALWLEARDEARHAGDRWLEGWPLQRLPLALTCLGRLEEAEHATVQAEAWTRQTSDFADLSLVAAATASIALARGHMDAVETSAREAMRALRRSGYPWGGAIALTALAQARCLRGDFVGAEDALLILSTPGEVFDEPGPGVQLVARAHALAIATEASVFEGSAPPPAPDLEGVTRALAAAGLDANALSALCALAETLARQHRPDLARLLVDPIERAAERGCILANGGVALLARARGLLELAMDHREAAIAAMTMGISQARVIGARPELARALTTMSELQQGLGIEHVAAAREALEISRALSLGPTCRRAERILADATPNGARREAESAEDARVPSSNEMRLLLAASPGRSLRHAARDLVLREDTVRQRLEELDLENQMHRGARVEDDAEVVVVATDIVGSTSLIHQLGAREALALFRRHHTVIRECIERHGGQEFDDTGDGLLVGFTRAGRAAAFSRAAHEAAARLRAESEGPALRLRIGLDAGLTLAREGRKRFGVAVVGAVRLCAASEPGEVLLSPRAAAAVAREGGVVSARGERELKGLPGRLEVYRLEPDTQ